MTNHDGPVIITASQIYQALRALEEKVSTLGNEVRGLPDALRDQDSRLRSVESRVWMACGVTATIAATAGVVLPILIR